MKNSNRTQKKQSSRVLFAIAALVISIAVISCTDGGIAPDRDITPDIDLVIYNFSFGPFETAPYQNDYAFTMEAEVDEQTKSIIFDKKLPDVTDIPVRIEIPQGAQLTANGQTYDGPLVSFTYDTSLTEIRIEGTGDPESYTLPVMIRRESVAQTIEDMQGTTVDAVAIFTEVNFEYVRKNLRMNFFLVNDITLTENFDPIGDFITKFTGIFEGNGKTISNLKIVKPKKRSIGFFGAIAAGGEIRNLRLILADEGAGNPSIEGNREVGALVGHNQEGSISNVGVEGGYVKSNSHTAGGLAGVSLGNNSIITGSYATATVEGTNEVGGLVGYYNYGVVRDSYATGAVTGTTKVGGLIGISLYNGGNRRIENTYATGAVTGTTKVGGLIGEIYISSSESADGIVANYFDATLTGQSQGVGNIPDPTGINPYYTYADNQKVYTAADGGGRVIQQSDFSDFGWDFTGDSTDGNEDIWHWSGDGIWPRLAWQQ